MGDSLTSKAEVQRLPCHDPQPSASPSRKRSKDEQRDWRGKSEGALSSGNTSAHARGGLPGDAKKERGARARPACRPAKFSPTLAYFLTLSPRAGRPPPPRGPNAFGQRGAPDRKWPLRPSALDRGKVLLLTASKIASRVSKARREGARSGAVTRLPSAFLGFPSLTCQTPGGKVSPGGQPASSGGGDGPRAAGRARTRPAWSPCDVTREFLGRHAHSFRLWGGDPYFPCGRAGSGGCATPGGGDWRLEGHL